jgi:hypothetical protein
MQGGKLRARLSSHHLRGTCGHQGGNRGGCVDSNRAAGSFEPAEGTKEVLIDPENCADKKVRIGTALSSK